jgi:hypothetical protein
MPQALQRTDIYHTVYAGCFIVPAGVATILGRRREPSASGAFPRRRPSAPVTMGAIVIALAIVTFSILIFRAPATTTTISGRSLPTGSEERIRLAEVADILRRDVPPGSTVFMGSQDMSRPGLSDMALYFFLPEYRTPFYYLELAPGASERAGSPLLHDVLSADALVLRDTSRAATDSEFPHIGAGVQDVNEAVRDHFCLIETIGVSHIYTRGSC